MLSRVAESLYWMARYVERAEDVTRILDVTFHGLLDTEVEDRDRAWQQVIALLGDEALFAEHFEEYTAANVSEFVLWHPGNPNAVASCITLARENARSVREQISGEMWTALNNLFLLVRRSGPAAVARGPHAFFEQLRNGAHLFQGAADATMIHGEPYEFIELGLHLERAEKTARVVATRYPVAASLPFEEPSRAGELSALLQSCSAFEAYIRHEGTRLESWPIAEYLVHSDSFPRAALYCLETCLHAVERISLGGGSGPHRLLGRLCAELEFADVIDTSGPAVQASMQRLLSGIGDVGAALTTAYFSSQALPASAIAIQEGQQQQCG